MAEDRDSFFVIKWDFLPEVFKKTLIVKDLLNKGDAKTVNEAVEEAGISRSAYYKYKDGVYPYHQMSEGRIITLSFYLEHRPGTLSKVLNTVAEAGGNIVMINQGIPLQGMAYVSLSIETEHVSLGTEDLMRRIKELDGTKKVALLSLN